MCLVYVLVCTLHIGVHGIFLFETGPFRLHGKCHLWIAGLVTRQVPRPGKTRRNIKVIAYCCLKSDMLKIEQIPFCAGNGKYYLTDLIGSIMGYLCLDGFFHIEGTVRRNWFVREIPHKHGSYNHIAVLMGEGHLNLLAS